MLNDDIRIWIDNRVDPEKHLHLDIVHFLSDDLCCRRSAIHVHLHVVDSRIWIFAGRSYSTTVIIFSS